MSEEETPELETLFEGATAATMNRIGLAADTPMFLVQVWLRYEDGAKSQVAAFETKRVNLATLRSWLDDQGIEYLANEAAGEKDPDVLVVSAQLNQSKS